MENGELRKLIIELADRPQGIRSPELAKKIKRSVTDAGSYLRRMEKRGILTREPPEQDIEYCPHCKRRMPLKPGRFGYTYYAVPDSYGKPTKACNPLALGTALGYPTRRE